MVSIGLDCGSRMIKICLFDKEKMEIIDCHSEENIHDLALQPDRIIRQRTKKYHISKKDIISIICTGYGGKRVHCKTKYSSEILCHARGVNFLYQRDSKNNTEIAEIKTIIDIGGQDSKIIKVENNCRVVDFMMNDKCAAGSGRFLDKLAQFFGVGITDLGELSLAADKKLSITSTCVVFAESEIIHYVSSGEKKENIIQGIHNALVHSVMALNGKIKIEHPITFVGGVSKNIGMHRAMEEYFKENIYVPNLSEMTGAIGAAIS